MDTGGRTKFAGGLRPSNETAIEESGLLGTRRGYVNINRFEIIFLIVGIIAAIATDSLTIIRLTQVQSARDADFAYGILILVNSVFLLLFLLTGILYQRITDIVAFFISAVMLTIYVIIHYVARSKGPDSGGKDATIRLIRLIFTIIFNIGFVPLAAFVIKDYRRDEFSKRLFGAFPAARRPLQIYNTFDCFARINTMLSISTFILNLYNFNGFESIDRVLLGIGIPFVFLWLGVGVGMVRLENRMLVVVFYLISLFQPGFLAYALYSAIDYASSPSMTTTPATTPSTMSSTLSSTMISTSTATPKALVAVPNALYVCIGINLVTHVSSMIFAFLCVGNFGKGLKERVFNNRFDKWFQRRFSSNTSQLDEQQFHHEESNA